MDGIRITGQVHFAELFAPIFPLLKGCYWVTLLRSIDPHWLEVSEVQNAESLAAELERDIEVIGEESERGSTLLGQVSALDLFPKYAKAVSEDWATIYGFRSPIASPRQWLEGYYEAKDRVGYASATTVCFCSIDGAYWEFYTREVELHDLTLEHLRKLPVSLDNCDMRQCYGI